MGVVASADGYTFIFIGGGVCNFRVCIQWGQVSYILYMFCGFIGSLGLFYFVRGGTGVYIL